MLQTPEAFEKALREEVSVSAEFDLPLAALALVVEGAGKRRCRRALDTLRAVELSPSPLLKSSSSPCPTPIGRRPCGRAETARGDPKGHRRGALCRRGRHGRGLARACPKIRFPAVSEKPDAT